MKKIFLLGTIILSTILSQAQKYWDLGFFVGSSYYIGDINPGKHFKSTDTHPSFGLHLRKNTNSRWSFKSTFKYGKVSAKDSDSDDLFQKNRNLSFESVLIEAGGLVEFNFLSYNPYNKSTYFQYPDYFTPYVFIGLTGFYFEPKTELNGNRYNLRDLKTEGKTYQPYSFAIPFGMGIKLRITERIGIEFEYGFRKTFTDYLDDVSSTYPTNPNSLSETGADLSDRSLAQQGPNGTNWGTQRGDSSKNDSFSFAGISLIFNINRNPNRCHFDQDK